VSDVTLPRDLPKQVREWMRGEGAKIGEKEEPVGELIPAMERRGHDSAPIREMMGGLDLDSGLQGLQTEVQTRR
jgi:hypothetical protein